MISWHNITRRLPADWSYLAMANTQQVTVDNMVPWFLNKKKDRKRLLIFSGIAEPITLYEWVSGVLRGACVIKDGHMAPSTEHAPPEGVDTSYIGIDWLVVEGENEPMHPAYVRRLMAQCNRAGIPFYFAGWGEWASAGTTCGLSLEQTSGREPHRFPDGVIVNRVGKEHSGRMLDGREWLEVPEGISLVDNPPKRA